MNSYVLRRVGLLLLNLVLVSVLVFVVVRLLPGDAVLARLQDKVSVVQLQRFREQLGLTRPAHVQYLSWAGGVLVGDFGLSFWSGRPVAEEMATALPVTVQLSIIAIIVAVSIGLPVAVISSVKRNSWADYLSRTVAILGISAPSFWLGTMAIALLSVKFGWLPPLRYAPFWKNPSVNLQQFWLPGLVLGIALASSTMRMARTAMLEVLRQDYIRTARAKGLHGRVVIFRHALRNAMIPVVTVIGIDLTRVMGGAVVIESIFNLPGLGGLMFAGISNRDVPMVMGINLLAATFTLLVNFTVDLSLGWFDPRIRYQ